MDQDSLPEDPNDVGLPIRKVIAGSEDLLLALPIFVGLIECPMPDGTIIATRWTAAPPTLEDTL